MAAVPGGMGQAPAMGMAGQVSQYWEKNIADSFALRVVVWALAGVTILLQGLIIFGCVPSDSGGSSSVSQYYLLEFNSNNFNYTQTTRLRVGYTAMCATISGASEHCVSTVNKDADRSIRYLSTGNNDYESFNRLNETRKLDANLFNLAQSLQKSVFCVLPALPSALFLLGMLVIAVYGLMNRPWVGAASSWRQAQRNRKLDIMRLAAMGLIALSVGFSFAIATAISVLFAAFKKVSALADPNFHIFTAKTGNLSLALHWLVVVFGILFLGSIIVTHTKMSSVSVQVTPNDTAGTTGSRSFSAVGGQLEKARLLQDAEPMAINPTSMTPMPMPGSRARGAARGAARAGGRTRGAGMGDGGARMGQGMGRGQMMDGQRGAMPRQPRQAGMDQPMM